MSPVLGNMYERVIFDDIVQILGCRQHNLNNAWTPCIWDSFSAHVLCITYFWKRSHAWVCNPLMGVYSCCSWFGLLWLQHGKQSFSERSWQSRSDGWCKRGRQRSWIKKTRVLRVRKVKWSGENIHAAPFTVKLFLSCLSCWLLVSESWLANDNANVFEQSGEILHPHVQQAGWLWQSCVDLKPLIFILRQPDLYGAVVMFNRSL